MKPEQLQDSFLKNTEMQYAADYQHIVVQFQSPPTLVPLQNLHVAKGQQMNLSKEVFFSQGKYDMTGSKWLGCHIRSISFSVQSSKASRIQGLWFQPRPLD